jgi:cell division protein FtsX
MNQTNNQAQPLLKATSYKPEHTVLYVHHKQPGTEQLANSIECSNSIRSISIFVSIVLFIAIILLIKYNS